MSTVPFPSPEVIAGALRTHTSIAAAARSLGIKERTLQERVQKGDYTHLLVEPGTPVEIPVIRRDYADLDHLYVYPLGDLHIGAPMHDRARWEQWIRYLNDTPNTSLLGTGDFLNAAIIGSKSDVYDERFTVGAAKRVLRSDLHRLAEGDRIDLLLPGNHEDRVYRSVGDCPIQDVAEDLAVPYARTAAVLVYTVGDVEYEVYVRHGTGMGQNLAQLAKGASVVWADIYITGHTHKLGATAEDIFVREGDRLVRRHRYFLSAGSFLGLEPYAAARGYAPTRLGGPRLYLNGRRKDVHVSI